MRVRVSCLVVAMIIMVMGVPAMAQPAGDTAEAPRPKLLVVGTAHLDTQWRWTVRESIDEFIPATFRDNIKLMDQFPEYVFSFEGAFRYMLMKEYYPDDFERVRPYVASGQWRVTGSWVDAVDVNIPSFESLVRQTLYGNGYFKREFGKTSRDIFLPDCFGFGYALPSIATHCGLKSFSTQKLTWGSWTGIPFDIGIWQGVDGSSIIGAVNPGAYVAKIDDDLSRDTTWLNAAEKQGQESGLFAAYRYFGVGDSGGAPDSASVDWLAKSIANDGPLEVISAGADDIVDIVATVDREALPHYDNELIMTRHGAGCYTSQAAMKRWNRKNELLADAAERASVIAHHLGGLTYPRDMLRDTWIRFLWHQFHDDLTGTSIPEAYEFSWNDEILCQNRFAAILTRAVASAAPALDTRGEGVPLIVFNPLSIARQEVVEAIVHLPGGNSPYVRVFGPDGDETPSDVAAVYADSVHIRFLANVPSVGYAVYDVRPSGEACTLPTGLAVSERTLENSRYRISLNDDGDVASMYDKRENREMLSAPIRYQFLDDSPNNWPAWEIDYDDIMSAPLGGFVGPPVVRVIEDGRTRVALEIERRTEHSVIKTTVRLSTGDAGDRVEFDTDIDWAEHATLLKLAVATTTGNDEVTYDLGLGVIERPVNTEDRYEVPGQQWADLTSPTGDYGVAILNDCRYGWDHPDSNTLRLTLIHTPAVADGWSWVGDESTQDQGRHRLRYALQGHAGNWHAGGVPWQAAGLNQPLLAFQTSPQGGTLGKRYSQVTVSGVAAAANPAVMVNALKLAENSDEFIIRVRELAGAPQDKAVLSFDRPVISAREVNGQEEEIGPARIENGTLLCTLMPFQPKAFAVRLEPTTVALHHPAVLPVDLPFNLDGISLDDDRCNGNFDGHGYALSGDLVPDTLDYLGLPFVFGPTAGDALNVVTCQGQQVPLPQGNYDRLYLLAAAVNGPAGASFSIDDQAYPVSLPDYADPIGQWDNRVAGDELVSSPEQIAPAYINRTPVAWYASHRHTPDCENDTYRFTYMFLVSLEMSPDATVLTLPSNDRIRVLAATLIEAPAGGARPVQPLYDEADNTIARISVDSSAFAGQATLSLTSPNPAVDIYYTLDGTLPTASSARYTKPITVTGTTTINARAIKAGSGDEHVATRTVVKIALRDAVPVGDLSGGLNCRYYEGEWERLPNYDTLDIVAAFVADTVAIPETARDEDYGLTFTGYVKVPADGIYAFSINSDDGSRLIIADTSLVDNDGLHGDDEKTGLIGLKAGYHRITAHMFQCKGGEALGASVAGPSLPKQKIPAAMLFHEEEAGK